MENQCAYLLTLQRVFGHPLTSGIVQAHTNSHLVLIILLTISSCFYKNMRYLQVSTNYPTVYFPPLAPGRPTCAIVDFVIGCRGLRTGRKLWGKIKDIRCTRYMADYWHPYPNFVPK